jgi:hypothetical protein
MMQVTVDPKEAQKIEAFMQKASAAGYSEDEIKAAVERKYAKQPAVNQPAPQERGWGDVAMEGVSNIPSSAANFAQGIYQAARHPIDTGMSMWDAAAGGLRNVMPEAVVSAIDRFDNPDATKRIDKTADAIGQFYKDRYGSMEELKETLATDPVGAASDLSAVLTGGAALAGRAPKLADALRKGASATNPMNIAGNAITATGRGAAQVIGNLGTHTGGESINEAARAGLAGGDKAKAFAANLRGKVPYTEVLDDAKANLEQMGRAKSAEYRAGMANVSGDKTILDFNGIDKALSDARGASQFKGQVKNAKAAELLQKMNDEISNWKRLNPAEYHTPEGLDALKQKIGGLVEGIPFEEKTARLVGQKVYGAIKGEITKQAPVYADVMKNYSDATEQIREIERALSLGGKASVDTAMRKLQSLTRNNANTNYGNRLELAQTLEQQGGREIMPALAGQALNTWTPRGLGGAVAGGLGLGGYSVGGPALAAALMAVQSPRLMGEAAFKTGQVAKALKQPSKMIGKTGVDPTTLANMLYQADRFNQ